MDTGDSTDHTRVDRRTVLQAVGGIGLGAGIAPVGADSGTSTRDEPGASVADSPGATAGGDQRWAFGEPADGVFSSPTVVDRTVYVGSNDGTLYAVASGTGAKEWDTQLVDPGTVESWPTVVDGTLYVGSADFSAFSGTLHAVNPDTGAEEWTFEEPTDWILSSPTVADGTVYVGSNDGTLYAVDIATESQQWAFEAPPGQVRSSPTVFAGTVFVGTDGTTDDDGNDGALYAVDAETGEQEWVFETPTHDVKSSPTVAGGTVYVGSGNVIGENEDSTLYAVDAATGEQQWAFDAPSNWVNSSPTVADGSVYVGSDDETLYAVETGVDASSSGSRGSLGTLGHAEGWDGTDPGGTVSGTVTDEGSNPIEGATATLLDSGETVTETTTDTAGTYSLSATAGTYTLTVDQTGFDSFSGEVTLPEGGETTRDVTLTSTSGTVAGTVTDPDSDPVEGATVTLLDSGETIAETTTDTAGAYSVTVAPGTYTLTVEQSGFEPFSDEVTVTENEETTRDVILTPTDGTVAGTVTDPNSDPVEGATVTLLDSGTTVAETTTDAVGAYSLGVAVGTYTLTVEQAGFEPFSDEVTVTENEETTRDVTLTPADGTVAGTVTDPNSDPVEGATVSLLDSGETVAETTTDTAGAYSLGAPVGTYTLTVEQSGFEPFSDEVTITENEEMTRDVTLTPPDGTVLGTVTDEGGSPVEGATATLLDGGTVAETTTDTAGTYSLSATAGVYTLTVEQTGFEPFSDEVTLPEGGETTRDVTLTAAGGTVFGTVTDPNGDPVDGATVSLLDSGATVAETTTDTAGAYSLAVVPGTYDLLVDADTLPPFEETVDIGTGESTVDVSLAPPSLPSTGAPPRDLDGDGRYEDIDGDGSLTIFDVQAFFVGFETETVGAYPGAFAFSADDGEVPETITIFDVQALFTLLVESD